MKKNRNVKKYSNSTSKRKRNIVEKPITVKKLKILSSFGIVIFLLLIFRLFWIQFVNGASLKERAYRQQTSSKIISPKRGAIYDVNGKALAISEDVDTVSINPSKISKEKKELVAKGLSEIFSLDYDETLSKVNSSSSIETIAKKVENDKISELKTWMEENKLSACINIDEDTKRYYPYSELASQVIGFCGTDNQGLAGIEDSYDSILTGESGKIITTTDLNDSEISDNRSTYVEAKNGSDIYLTIDVNIQSVVEKYISKAVKDNLCETASAIAMEPSTGNILSMATYPNFNLNTPFEPNTKDMKKKWESLSSSEKINYLYKMWRNKNVADLYEPGSTFKTLVSSIALEENIVETDTKKDFYCKGYEEFNGTKIRCWSTSSHGYETLTQALANSCNPAFMQLGKRIGIDTFYKYFEAFGLFTETGIELPGESNSIFFDKDKVGPVELATISFGQRFNITPIQLITAISSIANGGKLMRPQIVSKSVNPSTNNTYNTEPKQVRQVISEEVANAVIKMMENVVTNGTGKLGAVKGYTIAGKTGTSEAQVGSNNGNTLSYVAIAPSENPQLVLLVILYNTPSTNTHGSTYAAPISSKILENVLPYLGVNSDEANIKDSSNNLSVPNVVNKTITEAEKILKNAGLTSSISFDGDKNSTIVTTQVPAAGTKVTKNSIVLLYSEENSTRTSVTVPDLKGMTLSKAKSTLNTKNLNINYSGSGLVVSQSIKAGKTVEEGTVIEVTLSY